MDYNIKYSDKNLRIWEQTTKYKKDLQDRLFKFSIDTFKFLKTIPFKKEYDVFRYQLSKSSTSMGANYEEAQGAFTKKDFTNKISICLKESRETYYFFRLIQALEICDNTECNHFVRESYELQNIFGSILVKLKRQK